MVEEWSVLTAKEGYRFWRFLNDFVWFWDAYRVGAKRTSISFVL